MTIAQIRTLGPLLQNLKRFTDDTLTMPSGLSATIVSASCLESWYLSRNPPPNFGYSENPNRCQTFYSILSCVKTGVALHYVRIDLRTSNGGGGKPGGYGFTPGVCVLGRESLVEILKFSPLSHLQCELDLLYEHSWWTTDITGKSLL